jgi:hypothetical protein
MNRVSQRGVFAAADGDLAVQRRATLDDQTFHESF